MQIGQETHSSDLQKLDDFTLFINDFTNTAINAVSIEKVPMNLVAAFKFAF